ncbi:hypothetical protein J2T08_001153 [Neorhizobium galegae]|nr:hypothetical protein [Neorhizobium galegae]MDQ0133252.1 hypothetical protein [Neorhizobium galegae]
MRETALKKPSWGAHGVAKVRTVGRERRKQGDGGRTGTINAKPVSSRHPMNSVPTRTSAIALPNGRVNLSRPGITWAN